ncbi:MAG: GNAT family N-acetyltransferase [Nocardioidaceae bacterium]
MTGVGDLDIRPLAVPGDIDTLHRWLTTAHARFWDMQDATRDDVRETFQRIVDSDHQDAFLGTCDRSPAFLVERYDPAHDEVGRHYPVRGGDVGMHFLVAPPERRIPGFTTAVIRAVMDLLFDDPATERVVVEPDVRNTNVHRLNAVVGFEVAGPIDLPDKTALLSFCTRSQYADARGHHRR